MNEQTQAALVQLAAKLGTTTEYLWGVLVRQACLDGIFGLIYAASFIVVALMYWKALPLWVSNVKRNSKDKGYYNSDVDLQVGFIWGGFIVLLLIAFIGLNTVGSSVASIINPEYWALNKILESI